MKKETYCLACRKYTKSINPKIVRNKHNRSMIQSNCAICGSKKSRFSTYKRRRRKINGRVKFFRTYNIIKII